MGRLVWAEEQIKIVKEFYPHFGVSYVAELLGLSWQQVKSKVDNLRLTKLPKFERLCIKCKEGFQYRRSAGLYCKECYSIKRKRIRGAKEPTMEIWLKQFLRTLRYRSKIKCDLDIKFLLILWEQQGGKCYYSNVPLQIPQYGKGRNPFTASVDRLDNSKGYTKDNVVWCVWACNAGKSELSVDEYIQLCKQVYLSWGKI
jgi:hypothetical protein